MTLLEVSSYSALFWSSFFATVVGIIALCIGIYSYNRLPTDNFKKLANNFVIFLVLVIIAMVSMTVAHYLNVADSGDALEFSWYVLLSAGLLFSWYESVNIMRFGSYLLGIDTLIGKKKQQKWYEKK